MEDRYTMIQGFLSGPFSDFAAVYDGHSGHHGAQHAAMRLHEYIAAQPAIRNARGGADEAAAVEKGLKDAFLQTDEEVVNTAVDKGRRYGTTVVCALRLGGTLYVAHAGDSRAVLCRDSKAVRLTQARPGAAGAAMANLASRPVPHAAGGRRSLRDHKPASVPEERKRIESQGECAGITPQKGGYVVEPSGNRMLNMSRALGDPDFKVPRRLVEAEPDVARVDLRPGSDQFLLLATDGVFDVLSDQEASDIVLGLTASGRLSNDSAEAAADAVCRKAIKAGSRDNTPLPLHTVAQPVRSVRNRYCACITCRASQMCPGDACKLALTQIEKRTEATQGATRLRTVARTSPADTGATGGRTPSRHGSIGGVQGLQRVSFTSLRELMKEVEGGGAASAPAAEAALAQSPSLVCCTEVPPSLATGLAFCWTKKAGAGVSVCWGRGFAIARLPSGAWSAPSFFSLRQASLGASLGFQKVDYLHTLQTSEQLAVFGRHRGVLACDAALCLGVDPFEQDAPQRVHAPAAGAAQDQHPRAFTVADGVMLDLSIRVGFIFVDDALHAALYGPAAAPEDILAGRAAPPVELGPLYAAMAARAAAAQASGEGRATALPQRAGEGRPRGRREGRERGARRHSAAEPRATHHPSSLLPSKYELARQASLAASRKGSQAGLLTRALSARWPSAGGSPTARASGGAAQSASGSSLGAESRTGCSAAAGSHRLLFEEVAGLFGNPYEGEDRPAGADAPPGGGQAATVDGGGTPAGSRQRSPQPPPQQTQQQRLPPQQAKAPLFPSPFQHPRDAAERELLRPGDLTQQEVRQLQAEAPEAYAALQRDPEGEAAGRAETASLAIEVLRQRLPNLWQQLDKALQSCETLLSRDIGARLDQLEGYGFTPEQLGERVFSNPTRVRILSAGWETLERRLRYMEGLLQGDSSVVIAVCNQAPNILSVSQDMLEHNRQYCVGLDISAEEIAGLVRSKPTAFVCDLTTPYRQETIRSFCALFGETPKKFMLAHPGYARQNLARIECRVAFLRKTGHEAADRMGWIATSDERFIKQLRLDAAAYQRHCEEWQCSDRALELRRLREDSKRRESGEAAKDEAVE
eukprot:scaffold30.g4425.t1